SIITFIESLAVGAGVAEIVFPIMLALGIFTRLGAAGLIGMTLFIQLAVFPTWDHWWNPAVWWFIALLTVLSMGPGRLSLDKLLGLENKQ
ncbi:MAG: DoxX family protein, partial [Paraglaciecola sp.]